MKIIKNEEIHFKGNYGKNKMNQYKKINVERPEKSVLDQLTFLINLSLTYACR